MIVRCSVEREVDGFVDIYDYIVLGGWPGINDEGLSYAVNTACFMDVPAEYDIGLRCFYVFSNRFTADVHTQKHFVELTLEWRRVADEHMKSSTG